MGSALEVEMKTLRVTLRFVSYIAHPYWPERQHLIDIQKKSGMNRARSQEKREEALRKYLEQIGMKKSEYDELERLADREWYRVNGKQYEKTPEEMRPIMIPRHQLSGCLVQSCPKAPAGSRFDPEQLRSLVQLGDFVTTKTQCDQSYDRFVAPTDGRGNKLSNQRALRHNEALEDFEAVGTVTFDENDVKEKAVLELFKYAGKYTGTGASRKMGYGRFTVAKVETVKK